MAKLSAKTSTTRRITKPSEKLFRASLERLPSRLNWIVAYIPFDVAKTWGTRGQLRVQGEINGFAFRTSIFPTGRGDHFLMVNRRMLAGARVVPGGSANFRLEPDTQKRTVSVPLEFKRILAQDRSLQRWLNQLSYSIRNEISKWIVGVKSPEARLRRSEQIAERLLATMEGERELPPILQVAFAQEPRAREGWRLMSPSQRRMHLLGIFYYRTPEARSRRMAKAIEDAIKIAGRKANRSIVRP